MGQATSCTRLADILAVWLQDALQDVPDGFLDTFEYTTTGANLTHPIVIGLLSRWAWSFPGARFVGIDVRLNCGGGVKFHPDVVVFDFDGEWKPLLFLDYESPNSSDARIPQKDIDAYRAWSQRNPKPVPYIIVTTLPDGPSPRWELRYTSRGHCNDAFQGRRTEVRRNPSGFWYSYYRPMLAGRDIDRIAMVNISGKRVVRVVPEAAF